MNQIANILFATAFTVLFIGCEEQLESRDNGLVVTPVESKSSKEEITREMLRSIVIPKIDFEQASIGEACEFLEKAINGHLSTFRFDDRVEILVEENDYQSKISFSIENAPVDLVLSIVERLVGINYRIEDHKVIFEDDRVFDLID